MVLSVENVSWMIFGDGCVGHKCMDTTVARPTKEQETHFTLSMD